MKYTIIGMLRRVLNDCEAETMEVDSYAEALQLKKEFAKNRKYKKVFIVKNE